jgi:hypothetical protein
MAWRVIAGIIGALFLVNAAGWLVNPLSASVGLGMPLLDGVARSTQIGDIGGLFLAIGGLAFVGAWQMNAHWIRAAGLMLAAPALMRTLAWLVQEAAFATFFIVFELVGAGILLFAAGKIDADGAGSGAS